MNVLKTPKLSDEDDSSVSCAHGVVSDLLRKIFQTDAFFLTSSQARRAKT